ncbi:hypothetical protein BC833DRAFT_584150 [Globomyces pollinis-pini]|nr:hypothetical protein BC833DRAFT_584150 [Globomyces pollinis-pini]
MGTEEILKAKQSGVPTHQKVPESKLATRLTGLAWIAAFIFLANYLDFIQVLADSMGDFYFYISAASLTGFGSCFLYLTVYLPKIKGLKVNLSNWEQESPRTIQLATTFLVSATFSLHLTFWKSYGYVTPVFLFTGLMATVSLFGFL